MVWNRLIKNISCGSFYYILEVIFYYEQVVNVNTPQAFKHYFQSAMKIKLVDPDNMLLTTWKIYS